MTDNDSLTAEKIVSKERSLIKKNTELNSLDSQIEKKHSLILEKTKFIDRLESKINKLANKTILTQMKYTYYKWWYDILNIFIIFISSCLTVIEAVKNEIDYESQKQSVKYFFKLSPIIISTVIVIIGSILKFLRFQENLEKMARITEKSILTIYRMKKVQEESHFASNTDLEKYKGAYLDEIFIMYNQCQAEIGKCFKFDDLITYSNEKKKIILKGNKKLKKIYTKYDVDSKKATNDEIMSNQSEFNLDNSDSLYKKFNVSNNDIDSHYDIDENNEYLYVDDPDNDRINRADTTIV